MLSYNVSLKNYDSIIRYKLYLGTDIELYLIVEQYQNKQVLEHSTPGFRLL